MPRILFVHNHPARLVEIDRDLLKERWDVVEWHQQGRWVDPAALWKAVRDCDLVVGWFASRHTLLPILMARLLKRPSLLVIDPGQRRGGCRRVIRAATRLMTNSHSSKREIQANLRLPAERVTVIAHGVPDPFGKLPDEPKTAMALTVGNVNQGNLTRKGMRAFCEAARHLPQVTFVVAGQWQDDAIHALIDAAPSNLIFTGWLDDAMLNHYYRQAHVYVQASQREGLGLSVAEAMLAGCIPVVSQAGALPELVGDAGIVIDAPTPKAIATGVIQAMSLGAEAHQKARFQILSHFGLERRRQALWRLVEELVP